MAGQFSMEFLGQFSVQINNLELLIRFSREQPLATALIALGIGYLLGKML
jgi:hypothetical protein